MKPHCCLGCGYDLRGLDPPTRCPECGLDHDFQTLVVPARNRHRGLSLLLLDGGAVAAWLVLGAINVALLLSMKDGHRTPRQVLVLVVASIAALIGLVWGVRRLPQFALRGHWPSTLRLRPEGHLVSTRRRRRTRERLIPWSRLRVCRRVGPGTILYLVERGFVGFFLGNHTFDLNVTNDFADHVGSEIRRRIRAARQQSRPRIPPFRLPNP